MKTISEINEKIRAGTAVVLTAEEVVRMAREQGVKETAKRVDVVTTGTFSPMCSSGAFLNFGHAEPLIRMSGVKLNDVPACAGLAAVDCFLGATELSETRGMDYGGASEDEEYVEYVRSQDVAQSQLAFLLGGRHHAGGELRQGSAAGKDGDGDELVGHTCHAGDLCCGVHEEPASDYEAGEPGGYKAESGCETQLPALGLSLAGG